MTDNLPPLPELPPHEVEEWSESYITLRGEGWKKETVEKYAVDYARAALEAGRAAVPAERDVTSILLDIQPGFDGMGVEVYAKTVRDVEDRLTAIGQELEEWQLGIRRHPTAAAVPAGWRALAERCLSSMQDAVRFVETGIGRPPSQTCLFEIEELRAMLAAAPQPVAQPSEPVVWNSPEDTDNAQDFVWLRENGVVFLGYYFDQPFREYRDMDGHYVGQQDAESYWARQEDGEPCDPDGWCQLLPPLPSAQAKPEQAQPMTRAQVKGLMESAGYVTATPQEQADFISGIRHAELHHGITASPKD